jgi:hypothetical protein
LEKAERLAARLRAGTVWINSHHKLNPNVPFGGIKDSGLGAEHGLEGIKSYCSTKSIFINAQNLLRLLRHGVSCEGFPLNKKKGLRRDGIFLQLEIISLEIPQVCKCRYIGWQR